jgi:hypothetical protein
MSLSNLLDIQQPQDLLRGLLNTMTEYEQSKEDSDKPKIVCGPSPSKIFPVTSNPFISVSSETGFPNAPLAAFRNTQSHPLTHLTHRTWLHHTCLFP